MLYKLLLAYFLLVNAAAFILMMADKIKARKNRWRIKESTLMLWAAIGGSIGALAGMYTFRHKTLHRKFTIGIPAILILQIAAVLFILYKF